MSGAKKTKLTLRRIAWAEAAAVLANAMDAIDLSPDLTIEDEEFVREFIRDEIVTHLQARASGPSCRLGKHFQKRRGQLVHDE